MLSAIKKAAACAGIAACAAIASAPASAQINDNVAPEFAGIHHWHNSEPLALAQLRGKVVLVDFWTFACGNCINTLPAVKSWNQKYKDKGLVVVGVHTPEFPFEQDTNNVKRAIERFGITYPVAQDNRYATWAAYGNQYWPAFYLIDKHGRVAYTHFGEGEYAQTEAAIQKLLAER
ncbi:redoxin domain-containing protein [Caballeronia temeraria]|uniref:Redoxin domain-containing protein n=1 Tax=Caballeronia temeraria TaxID=1777137 RepID=A0A158DD85_9BURK|nr:thioredoxin family protein [Caballeronia temeraria]SAK92615.1 redoxin domain-containing protein [Caballeronia temeraria]